MRRCLRTGLQAVEKHTRSGAVLARFPDFSGTPDQPGLIYLTTQELFERCASLTDKKVEISLSFLEIYNETIRDLLVPIEDSKGLMLREDAEHRISVPGLTTASPATVGPVKSRLRRSMRS
jgi:kinesin family protein 18/19